ncbi:MAG: hypothetical protein QM534_03280 [Sediminibacterium sp.]|nr:hypothetical protein [Sediminibacterium sp.]
MENRKWNSVNNQDGKQGFSTPSDYFTSTSGNILNKLLWLEEHKAYPILSASKGKTGFVVPDGYFEGVTVKTEMLPYQKLYEVHGKNGHFVLPDQYFEQLPPVSPVLYGIEKVNPFEVPAGYFQKNEERLKPKGRVVSLFPRRIQYSIAAIMVICLGIWLFQALSDKIDTEKDCGTLACVDKKEILESHDLQTADEDKLYDIVNVKALEEKLKEEKTPVNGKSSHDSVLIEAAEDAMDEL